MYFSMLPDGMEQLFFTPIYNPPSPMWYQKMPQGIKPLTSLVKYLATECGLDVSEGKGTFSNKCGRTTMISQMSAAGVPNVVGMLLSGHKNENSYSRYDRSTESKVRAAQRCIADPTMTYDATCALEKERTIKVMLGINLKEQEMVAPARKKAKLEEVSLCDAMVDKLTEEGKSTITNSDVCSLDQGKQMVVCHETESAITVVDLKGKAIAICHGGKQVIAANPKVLANQQQGECPVSIQERMALKIAKLQQELQFTQTFNWDADFKTYEGARAVLLNLINAVF